MTVLQTTLDKKGSAAARRNARTAFFECIAAPVVPTVPLTSYACKEQASDPFHGGSPAAFLPPLQRKAPPPACLRGPSRAVRALQDRARPASRAAGAIPPAALRLPACARRARRALLAVSPPRRATARHCVRHIFAVRRAKTVRARGPFASVRGRFRPRHPGLR